MIILFKNMFDVRLLLTLVSVTSILSENIFLPEELRNFGYASENDSFVHDSLSQPRLPPLGEADPSFPPEFVLLQTWNRLTYLLDDYQQRKPEEILNIMNNLLSIPYRYYPVQMRDIIYSNFQYYISHIPIENYESDDWILRVLYPFRDNITGLAVYKDGETNRTESIYSNQTENDIDTENLEVAGFIPREFLKKLRENKSGEELNEIAVRMLLVLNGISFQFLWDYIGIPEYFIGVSIPNYCKEDRTPYLKAYFKNPGNGSEETWEEFGKNYVDDIPVYEKRLCLLSQMTFFSRINEFEYFDSVSMDYCVQADTGFFYRTVLMIWPLQKVSSPNQFCVDQNYDIPGEPCEKNELMFFEEDRYHCRNDLSYSKRNQLFYEMLLYCQHFRITPYCDKSYAYIVNNADSYLDVIIAMRYTYILPLDGMDLDYLWNSRSILIEKGLSFLEKDVESPQITLISKLFTRMVIPKIYSYLFHLNDHFKHLIMSFLSPVVGFIIYNNRTTSLGFDVRFLTTSNATLDYCSGDNVRVVAYVTRSNTSFSDCNLIVLHGNYAEYSNQTTKSDVVEAFCYDEGNILNLCINAKNDAREINKEYYLNDQFELKPSICNIFYIFASNSHCNQVFKLSIFEIIVTKTYVLLFGNAITGNISLSLNANADNFQNSTILNLTISVISSLSILSIIILMSALFFKNQHEQRIYLIQLIVAMTGSTIFFIISENTTRILYFITYYFFISELIWILIIANHQYVKYFKMPQRYYLNSTKITVIGWILPIPIVLISIFPHLECFQCNFCAENLDVLMRFAIIPLCIIFVLNTVLYTFLTVRIWRYDSKLFSGEIKSLKNKAGLFLLCILGISWIFLTVVLVLISHIGFYVFMVVVSSQGIIIFVLVVLLDREIRNNWCKRCSCDNKLNSAVPSQVELHQTE